MAEDLSVFCADIGSVQAGRFGWYGEDREERSSFGGCIEAFVRVVSERLNADEKVALGFECPLYVPLREDPLRLTKARAGEGSRSWSAGAGCGAMATGIVEVAWILQSIRNNLNQPAEVFLDWGAFADVKAGLLLWEAFVSGKSKGESHAHDAELAVRAFKAALPNPPNANAVFEPDVVSLVGACLLRTGWSSRLEFLSERCLVIKA